MEAQTMIPNWWCYKDLQLDEMSLPTLDDSQTNGHGHPSMPDLSPSLDVWQPAGQSFLCGVLLQPDANWSSWIAGVGSLHNIISANFQRWSFF